MTEHDRQRQSPNLTLAVLALTSFVYAVLQSLVLPAIPSIAHAIHTSEASATWLLTAYLLTAAVATPIAGRLGDIYGKERVLFWTLVTLVIGTALSALANSILLLDVARGLQGTAGGIFPLAFGIVRDEFPRERVAGGIGFLSAILGVGGGAGILLAGPIVEHLNFHWLFWIPLPVIVIATVMTYFFVPESPVRTPAKINWTAAVLMGVGIAAVLLAISEAITWGWGSPKTLGLAAGGLVVCAAWIAWELRSEVPLVDMSMMRLRAVWTTNLAATLLGGGMYATFIIVPQFVQEPRSTGYGFGASVIGSSLYLLPTTLMMLVMSLQAGRLAHRFGSKRSLVAGTIGTAAGFVVLVVAHSQPWPIYVAMGLLGFGIGLAFAALGNLIVEAVPATQTGVASGMNTVVRLLGGAFGTEIAATFIADNSRRGVPLLAGFNLAFGMCLAFLLVAIVAAAVIPGHTPAQELTEIGVGLPATAPAE
jgi:EmrB/QacA subfamily drug resistance transporter